MNSTFPGAGLPQHVSGGGAGCGLCGASGGGLSHGSRNGSQRTSSNDAGDNGDFGIFRRLYHPGSVHVHALRQNTVLLSGLSSRMLFVGRRRRRM